jgi:hypothetical protein
MTSRTAVCYLARSGYAAALTEPLRQPGES